MELKDQTPADDKPPSSLRIVARNDLVAPLTPGEIKALRQLLVDFESIKAGCPIAKRAVSER